MTKAQKIAEPEGEPRTGRRPNPSIDGPRDQTVCFMLSKGEKMAVDRLAYCMSITRSGLLASIMAEFIEASKNTDDGQTAEKRLLAYLEECRKQNQKRGEEAAKWILP